MPKQHKKTAVWKIYKKWDTFEKKATKHFTKKQRKLWGIFIFLARFSALAIPLHLILWLNLNSHPLQMLNADILEKLLGLTGIDFVRSNISFFLKTPTGLLNLEVSRDCIGWKSMLAISGLVFAVRKVGLEKKLKGVLAGLCILFIGNIVRMFTTVYMAGKYGLYFFTLLHSFLWQWGLMALVLIIWVIWLNSASKNI